MARPAIYAIEEGTARGRIDSALALAKALGTTVEDLFDVPQHPLLQDDKGGRSV